MIRFEMVTPDNFEGVISLKLREDQIGFLENNLYSLAESKVFDYLEPRAIYNDEELIGFMLYYFQPYGVVRQMGPGEGSHKIHSDGITIIDNSGRIRAYNVFIETNNKKMRKVTGGARKRAAYTIINSNHKKIVGVYFQSHEGEIFYASVDSNSSGKKSTNKSDKTKTKVVKVKLLEDKDATITERVDLYESNNEENVNKKVNISETTFDNINFDSSLIKATDFDTTMVNTVDFYEMPDED